MEPTTFYADVAMQFGEAEMPGGAPTEATGGANKADQGGNAVKAIAWGEKLYKSFPDSVKRSQVERQIMNVAVNEQKIGTGDLSSVFVSSISPRMMDVREGRTVTLNIMESIPGPTLMTQDWSYRIVRRQQGYDRAPNVNPEAAIGATQEGVYEELYQTLAFWGFPIYETFVARAQAGQQANLDPFAIEVDNGLRSIRRAQNYDYLNAIRQPIFTGTNITKVGGLLSRVTTSVACGGVDVTDANLNTGYNAILDAVSGATQVFFLTNKKEIGAVRSMEITRYGGQNATSFAMWQQSMGEKAKTFGLNPMRFWEPNLGESVPFFYEIDLPNSGSHTGLMMSVDPRYAPRPVYFNIGGEVGPWLFALPQGTYLRKGVMLLHGGTMDDPGSDISARLYTNLPVG
jgi:hypothetical protein